MGLTSPHPQLLFQGPRNGVLCRFLARLAGGGDTVSRPSGLVSTALVSTSNSPLHTHGFASGYFIHDTVDIVISHQARASWEYLVHHVMAMGAFFSGIFWSSFVGGGVLTLLVEVSNIFLTFRMMMKINNAQHLLLYRVNKYVNLVMYFLFRLAPQAYLTHYFLRYLGQRTLGTFLLGILLMLDIMILIYFSRLLRSDFCPQRVPSQQHKDKFLTE
ncbi:TLC domain-containing protein 1 isoform X2 [Acinonyx jubatus]|uniref:TLC domain-containing protein 1 isoform X2 n=1 Tax=Acinonyx jubatus TaxID=32536 RepID=A0ABM3PAZ0_ACIJB|nr:TLC domain-containing protein 1 isoform X2 [Acinonyx jubatus]